MSPPGTSATYECDDVNYSFAEGTDIRLKVHDNTSKSDCMATFSVCARDVTHRRRRAVSMKMAGIRDRTPAIFTTRKRYTKAKIGGKTTTTIAAQTA